MLWVLIFITYNQDQAHVEKISIHNEMTSCFHAREMLSSVVGGKNGYFPTNTQAICLKVEK